MLNKFFLKFLGVAALSLFSLPIAAQDFQSEVVVESLPELSLNILGTMPSKNSFLWSKTPAENLLKLVDETGIADLTPAKRELVKQLLSFDISGTPFNDPTGILENDRFFIARIKALENQGEWETVLNLINLVDEKDITREIKQIKINTLFMKGEEKKACLLLEELPESENEEENIYADKMRISCFLAKEEKDKAILAYDIFQDAYPNADKSYISLADAALRELPQELDNELVLTPAEVYLYALIKNPKLDLTKQTREIKKTLSELPASDIVFRIQLGEQIGLSFAELNKLYSLPLINTDLNNPVVQRVLTYNQIFSSSDIDDKARLLFSFLALARQDNLLIPLAPLIAHAMREINPEKQYTDLALNAVQAFILTNNLSDAEPWFNLLKKSENKTHQEQYLTAALLMQTAGNGYPSDFEKRLNAFCQQNKSGKCGEIQSLLPQDMIDDLKFKTSPNASSFFEENDQAFTTRLGEFLLQSVLNLSKNKNTSESYRFIQKAARPKEGNAILQEGWVK